MEEWDLYSREGYSLGKKIRRGETIPPDCFHKVVQIWIINEREEFLIQKRANHLKWHPGKWATTTGSVIAGEEDVILSASREVHEELGLDNTKIDIEFEKEIIIGSSLVSIFKAFLPSFMMQQIELNDEVSQVKWMSAAKIEMLRKEDAFASYSDETFDIVFRMKLNMN